MRLVEKALAINQLAAKFAREGKKMGRSATALVAMGVFLAVPLAWEDLAALIPSVLLAANPKLGAQAAARLLVAGALGEVPCFQGRRRWTAAEAQLGASEFRSRSSPRVFEWKIERSRNRPRAYFGGCVAVSLVCIKQIPEPLSDWGAPL